MPTARSMKNCLLGLALAGIVPFHSATAALVATATISTSSASAPYNYTVTLHNTGTTNIGTLWFAWTDVPIEYNFLPHLPVNIIVPSGWLTTVSHNAIPGDGYGLEMYNYLGSPIAPGGTAQFKFTSTDSPAVVAGGAYIPPNRVLTSFVYPGFPQADPGYEFNVAFAPEPAGLWLAACGAAGCLALLARERKRRNRGKRASA